MTKAADYLELCHKSLTPLKQARLNHVIQLNIGEMRTYATCEKTSKNRELRLLRSIKNTSPFRRTMVDYICSSSYFVVSLQSESFIWIYLCIYISLCLSFSLYIYILHRTLYVWGKTYGINGKEALTN